MVTIQLSKNFVYDVLAHFLVNDVVALNNYQLNESSVGDDRRAVGGPDRR